MAVAIPIIVAYAAGAAGASAMVAGIAATAAAVVAAKTGISDKVNKAASNVFGEDLVKVGNIAGAAWMAYAAYGASSTGAGEAAAGEAMATGAGETAAGGAIDASQAGGMVGDYAMPTHVAAPGAAEAAAAGDLSAYAAQPTAEGVLTADTSGTIASGNTARVTGPKAVSSPSPPKVGTQQLPGREATLWDRVKGVMPTGDRAQAALIQVAGNTVAGFAQSAQEAKQLEEERRRQDEHNRRYRSGSGVLIGSNAYYGPRTRTPLPF